MSKYGYIFLFVLLLFSKECSLFRKIPVTEVPVKIGLEGMQEQCMDNDSIESLIIRKAEAILSFDGERYEAEVTLYSKRDSIIYLSVVNGGFEILRASVKHDTIRVISRLNKIVYSSSLKRRFGYQYPVNFEDLQRLIATIYLCNDLDHSSDNRYSHVVFDFDEKHIKKRIALNREGLQMMLFEYYHQSTGKYFMGERLDEGFKIFSNFMISEFEIAAKGGECSYNETINIDMEVNPRRYTFTELR